MNKDEFVIKLKDQWMSEDPENEFFQQNQTIYEELELTYDTLLSQKKMIDKTIHFTYKKTRCWLP